MPDRFSMFDLFKNRNYTLYFVGQLISQVGTWMQMVALSWFTYTLTQSPFLLAVVGASGQLPSLILMPIAGVAADRFNRHQMVIATQILAMIQAGILAFLTMTHQVQIWHLIALGVFAGIINAFDLPVRSAFVIGLVNKKEELPAAVSLNSSLMNFTRLLGPALAGFIVAAVGAGACFLINALSYIAAIVALIYIKGDFDPRRAASAGIVAELKEGLDYVWGTTPVRALILLLGFFALGGMAYALLLPIYVKQLGGDASMLGYMMSASAVGSLAGTLMLGIRGKIVGLGRWIIASSIGFSLALLGLGMVHSFAMALPVLALLGLTMMLQMASVNTILQAIVEENKRGRVMSYFTMAFMGAAPLGSLIAGGAAAKFGFSNTVLACGVYCLIVSAVFISHLPKLRPRMREIYIEKGLLIAEEERQLLST